jgi:1-acyl-sn-glycerol-3-phosphate acyltransferase
MPGSVAEPVTEPLWEPAGAPVSRPPSPPGFPAAPELLETAGTRFRRFMEQRLPALVEGVARSWIETLGLTAVPVEVSDVDAFGMSQEFVERWQPVLARLLSDYFRAELRGLEKLPAEGPAILVCNHSGVLPYDELLLKVAVRESGGRNGSPGRDIRPLSEDFAINAPFAGSFLNRFGLVRASRDNAERLLRAGHIIAAFPEGTQGIAKRYENRQRLQRFHSSGFVELALRTGAPLYPVALGPIGLLPLPSRWNIQVGDAIRASGGEVAAEDRSTVARVTEEVRAKLQGMLTALTSVRRSADSPASGTRRRSAAAGRSSAPRR